MSRGPQRAPAFPPGLGAARSAFPARIFLAHADCRLRGAGLAAFILYVRAHALRMPMRLLLPHLIHKALERHQDAQT